MLVPVEIVLRTRTAEDVEIVLPAIVYAKIVEEHPAVADLDLIDRTIRQPDERRPDVRPSRERFFRREDRVWHWPWLSSVKRLPSS
jgi:hypothetical protein